MPGATYNTHSPSAHRTFSWFHLIIERGLISELPFDCQRHHSDNESEVYV